MRFGIGFPTFGPYSDPRLLADLAREAENSAWDGCFVWDHVQVGWLDAVADPWVALTAITLATRRIRLGTLVTPLYRRSPWKLARETATLDHLSQGRLILGVGLGSDTFGEISAFGGPQDDRVRAQMLDEGLAVLTGLWSGESFSFSGKYFHIDNTRFIPTPVQQPRIPIWVAGTWPKRPPFRRAARYDGVIPVAGDVRSRFRLLRSRNLPLMFGNAAAKWILRTKLSIQPLHRRAVILIRKSSRLLLMPALPGGWRPCFPRSGRLNGRDRIRRGPPG
jgi:alkanesulfonate monooxygenase SsuD/methylene tetrahydromethanopterin reductase-like flavin-dependent oxidoreductase (luciferase family)